MLFFSTWYSGSGESPMSVPFEAIFKRVGAKYDVPWWLMAGMAHEASGFNPTIVGPTDDHGLMQVISSNAAGCGLTPEDLNDPEKNVTCAAQLLAKLFKRVNPLVSDAHHRRLFVMLANNMGWGNVGQKLKDGPRGWDDFKAKYPQMKRKYLWVERMDRRAESYRPFGLDTDGTPTLPYVAGSGVESDTESGAGEKASGE